MSDFVPDPRAPRHAEPLVASPVFLTLAGSA